MFTNMQSKNLKGADITALKDISNIKIDEGNPVFQRILTFIEQAGSPYLFKVGDTPVKVVFAKNYAHIGIEEKLAKIANGKVG